MSIRIILADDHKIVRDGLRALLQMQSDMEVIAEAENGETTVQLSRDLSPDVVVMDIGMPGVNGITATQVIIAENPRVKVIALSMHSDKHFVGGMLRAGASGYLLKDCAFTELVQAIRAVEDDQHYLSPRIAHVVVQDYLRHAEKEEPETASVLSNRERQVLTLIAEGKGARETAAILGLSVRTVDTHRQKIMNKLNIHKASELVKYAIREGCITLDQ